MSLMSEKGMTIIELMIGVLVNLVILGAVSAFFLFQNRFFISEERRLPSEYSARTAMNAIVREMRMTGYRRGTSPISPVFGTPTSVVLRRYTTSGAVTTAIETHYSRENNRLLRKTSAGVTAITGNMRQISFTFRTMTGNVATSWEKVRKIDVMIKTNVPKPDAAFGSYSTYTLTESVMPANLAY